MSNSTPVISLSSSDEEDSSTEPPSKKAKISPIMIPNVTLTLVSKPKAPKEIECVSLDSDDESKSSNKKKKPKTEISKIIHSILNNSTTFKKNGVTIFRNKEETVTLVDSDSDTEVTNKPADVESDTVNKCVSSSVVNGIETELVSEEKEKNEKPQNGESKTKSTKAIVIADSDEEVEKENRESLDGSESVAESASSSLTKVKDVKDEATQEAKTAFEQFLTLVIEKLVGSTFEEILPKKLSIMKKYFKKSGSYVNDQVFLTLLKQTYQGISSAPTCDVANSAVLAFHRVFQHLKTHMQQSMIEIEEDHVRKVKKLEKIIRLLQKKIKQLEETEVDFNDEEDSSYIILDRYQNRLKKVYAKYCEYIRRNPFSGRPIYDKISFVHSKYNEINQALSRKYQNSVHFPTYYEVEKYIKKTAEKAKLNLSDPEIKIESEKCFKHLGNILQKKRRQELYDSHLDFIELTEDPAVKDVALENILRKNYSEGKAKIDEICQKYVNMQEKGDDQVSSHNEDDKSSEFSSDSEEEVLPKHVIDADVNDKRIDEETKL